MTNGRAGGNGRNTIGQTKKRRAWRGDNDHYSKLEKPHSNCCVESLAY